MSQKSEVVELLCIDLKQPIEMRMPSFELHTVFARRVAPHFFLSSMRAYLSAFFLQPQVVP